MRTGIRRDARPRPTAVASAVAARAAKLATAAPTALATPAASAAAPPAVPRRHVRPLCRGGQGGAASSPTAAAIATARVAAALPHPAALGAPVFLAILLKRRNTLGL